MGNCSGSSGGMQAHTPGAGSSAADTIAALAFAPGGGRLAFVTEDWAVRLIETQTLQHEDVLRNAKTKYTAVTFSADGKIIAAGNKEGDIKVWNSVSYVEMNSLSPTFSKDMKYIAYGCQDKHLRIWEQDAEQQTPQVQVLRAHQDWVTSVAFSPDGTQLASASDDCTLRVWHLLNQQNKDTVQSTQLGTFKNFVESVAYSPDGLWLATGGRDKSIRLWNVLNQQLQYTLTEHAANINFVTFSTDSKFLASTSHDKTVRIWDIANLKTIKVLKGHQHWVLAAAFSPDSEQLYSVSLDGQVKIWHLKQIE